MYVSDESELTTLKNAPHILIIEDIESIAYMLRWLFKPMGYVISRAETVDEAIRFCQKHKYDLILINTGFSGRTGTIIAKYIGDIYDNNVPIIAHTIFHITNELKQRCKASGIQHVFKTPFTLYELQDILNQTSWAKTKD